MHFRSLLLPPSGVTGGVGRGKGKYSFYTTAATTLSTDRTQATIVELTLNWSISHRMMISKFWPWPNGKKPGSPFSSPPHFSFTRVLRTTLLAGKRGLKCRAMSGLGGPPAPHWRFTWNLLEKKKSIYKNWSACHWGVANNTSMGLLLQNAPFPSNTHGFCLILSKKYSYFF